MSARWPFFKYFRNEILMKPEKIKVIRYKKNFYNEMHYSRIKVSRKITVNAFAEAWLLYLRFQD